MPTSNSPGRAAVHTLTPRRKSGARGGGGKAGPAPSVSSADPRSPPGSAALTVPPVEEAVAHQEQEEASIPPPPAMAEKLGNDDDQGDDSGDASSSSSDSDSSDDDSSTARQPATPTTSHRPDRAAMIAQLPPDADTSGLSDYEVLRLYNIRRNEAKLASLGLVGITSPSHPGNADSSAVNAAKEAERKKKEAARKGAETRRKNKARADAARQEIERWERARKKGGINYTDYKDGDDVDGMDGDGGGGARSQPKRAAKSKDVDYRSAPHSATPKRLQQWRARFAELTQFYAARGHYRATAKMDGGKYAPLSAWLARQRTNYAKYKRGEAKSGLDAERVALLEGLEGNWRVKIRGGAGRRGKVLLWGGPRRLWGGGEDSGTDEDADWEAEERMRREVEDVSTEEEEEAELGGEDSHTDESVDEEAEYGRRGERRGKRPRAGYDFDDARDDRRGRSRSTYLPKKPKTDSLTSNWHAPSPASRARSAGRKTSPRAQRRSEDRRRQSRPGRSASRRRYVRSDAETEEESLVPRSKRRRRGRSSARGYDSSDTESNEEAPRRKRRASPRRASPSGRRGRRARDEGENSRRLPPYHRRKRRSPKKPMEEIVLAPSSQLSARAERHRRRDVQRRERDELMAEYGRLYGRRCAMVERRARLEYELRALRSFLASVEGAGVAAGALEAGVGAGAGKLLKGGAVGSLPAAPVVGQLLYSSASG